jgi:hypothetical protein
MNSASYLANKVVDCSLVLFFVDFGGRRKCTFSAKLMTVTSAASNECYARVSSKTWRMRQPAISDVTTEGGARWRQSEH